MKSSVSRQMRDGLANLQLLDGAANIEKQADDAGRMARRDVRRCKSASELSATSICLGTCAGGRSRNFRRSMKRASERLRERIRRTASAKSKDAHNWRPMCTYDLGRIEGR